MAKQIWTVTVTDINGGIMEYHRFADASNEENARAANELGACLRKAYHNHEPLRMTRVDCTVVPDEQESCRG